MTGVEKIILKAYRRASVCSFREDQPKIFLEALREAGYDVIPIEPKEEQK